MAKGTRLAVDMAAGKRRTAAMKAEPDGIRKTSVRWPVDVHRWLANKAMDERLSVNDVVLGMVRQQMAKGR